MKIEEDKLKMCWDDLLGNKDKIPALEIKDKTGKVENIGTTLKGQVPSDVSNYKIKILHITINNK